MAPTPSTGTAPARPDAAATGRSRPVVVAAALAALVLCVVGLVIGRGAEPLELGDPGALVRWGQPVVRTVHDLAAALTVGVLLMGGLLVPEGPSTHRRARTARLAAGAALVWGVAGLVRGVLAYAATAGVPVGSEGFWSQWWTFTWQLEVLRAPAITALIALVISGVATIERGRNAQAWLFFLALFALLPLALAGHAAGSADHDTAVNSLAAHLVGVTIWAGGLLALLLTWSSLGKARAVVIARYSRMALWCFVLVALSGLLNATVRLGSWSGLGSRYALVLGLKALALVALGLFGYLQREKVVDVLRRTPKDVGPRALFARLAGVEVLVMGAAIGLSTALAQSPPPVPRDPPPTTDPALDLTGYSTPPDFEPMRFLTLWRVEWLFTGLAVIALVVYLRWVVRLRRRGDSWPVLRSVYWVVGWLVFLYAVNSAVGVYGHVMFSVHMVEHMVISMFSPLFLVLAAPITLALRALPARKDATLGPRELLLAASHSRVLGVFGNPVVSAVFFFASLVVFYYTPLFGIALRTHTGHVLMVLHFMLAGYLFIWSLIGIDPGPRKWPAPMRLLVLLVTLAAHAFFGVALMTGTSLLVPEVFTQLRLPWVGDPLADQQAAGGVAWATGELPTMVLALLVTADWLRRDTIEARRSDRRADRDGDAELAAYNEYLARRAGTRRDGPTVER